MNSIYDDFALITLSTYNLSGLDLDQTKALHEISKEIEENFIGINKDTAKQTRHKTIGVLGSTAEDYTEYNVEIDSGRNIICGIRHMNLNKDFPFVTLETNFKSSKAEILDVYQKHLSSYFEVFQPKWIRYYTKERNELNMTGSCYLVQQSNKIYESKHFTHKNRIKLYSPKDDDYFQWYVDGYKAFNEKVPELAVHVSSNSFELMDECNKEGLLKLVEYQGQLIGLIAADRSEFLGAKGLYFNEIFLTEAYKGKGLAKEVQRDFILEVCKDNEIVWGTIDYKNQASYRTALSNDRKPIRFENFVSL